MCDHCETDGCGAPGLALARARLIRRPGADVERMHATLEQRLERCVHQAVALERGAAAEGLRDQRDAVVATLARPGMSDVAGAVVDALEPLRGEGRLQRCAHSAQDLLIHDA